MRYHASLGTLNFGGEINVKKDTIGYGVFDYNLYF